MIFSSATMIMLSSGCFAVGALVTALAPSFAVFILGRALLGVGSGGIMTLCMIVVIQLTSQKRRGLWIGLTNAVSIVFHGVVSLVSVFVKYAGVLTGLVGVHDWCVGGCYCVWGFAPGLGMGKLTAFLICICMVSCIRLTVSATPVRSASTPGRYRRPRCHPQHSPLCYR